MKSVPPVAGSPELPGLVLSTMVAITLDVLSKVVESECRGFLERNVMKSS